MSKAFWDERYAADQFAYGELPNDFLASMADRLPSGGTALDIGAGEGRNALFLAARGLDVLAVDQSSAGMAKASRLAVQRGLKLSTQSADLLDFDAPAGLFDVVSSIFVHLPTSLRAAVHTRLARWLRPGGLYIMEAYAPDQIARGTGGPKDPTMMVPLEVILSELSGLSIEHQAALVRTVTEGTYHNGEASVIQVVARRK